MAAAGQRFELDLESADFAFRPLVHESQGGFAVKAIREHETSDAPPAPTVKPPQSGFPAHKSRHKVSTFKQRQGPASRSDEKQETPPQYEFSDRAIRQQIGKKYGVDFEAQQKAEISEENKRRLAGMSTEDIEQARAELLGGLSSEVMEKLLRRANLEEDLPRTETTTTGEQKPSEKDRERRHTSATELKEEGTSLLLPDTSLPVDSSVHFPIPPRPASAYTPLNPDSDTFLEDLRTTYFPELAHDPTSLSWLQDATAEDDQHSSYNPDRGSYPASALRFDFNGRLIAPNESLNIPVSAGLHHHGDAPNSAGYTVPELTLLARSAMPNQRCIAYQTAGRIIYRLGKGEFGQRGSEIEEAIWDTVETERILELIMAEANKQGGHASAKAYATEALWLWRKGGGSDRGLLKPGERRAK